MDLDHESAGSAAECSPGAAGNGSGALGVGYGGDQVDPRGDTIRACAREHFREGIGESFGRHVRAIERKLIYDQGLDLGRIHVMPTSRLPTGVARMFITAGEYERVSGDSPLFPGETTSSLVIVKHVFIVVGTDGSPPAIREKGRELGFFEHHLAPKARLALAHELGHLALGHVTDKASNLCVPYDLSSRGPAEAAAKLYAVCLVMYSRTYVEHAAGTGKLLPTPTAIGAAVGELWGASVPVGSPLACAIEDVLGGKLPSIEGFDN